MTTFGLTPLSVVFIPLIAALIGFFIAGFLPGDSRKLELGFKAGFYVSCVVFGWNLFSEPMVSWIPGMTAVFFFGILARIRGY